MGVWTSSTTRGGAIRAHSTGMVAISCPIRATPYLWYDDEEPQGSEPDNYLGSNMIAFRWDPDSEGLFVDLNIGGGTVKTFTL